MMEVQKHPKEDKSFCLTFRQVGESLESAKDFSEAMKNVAGFFGEFAEVE